MWLEHPKYVPERERLISYLSSKRYRFRPLAPLLFLCGGAGSLHRDVLRNYLRKHNPKLGLFYAERVWERIASQVGRGALKMEADLADLADLVVIIVESPGTFAELGAFSLSDTLRKKLLPIVDEKYEDDPHSFISTGPLRWINSESEFAPTIYVSLPRILEAIGEIEQRISHIPKSRSAKISNLATNPKHLLFFLCDLIAVIHPVTVEMVEYYLGRIAPSILSSVITVRTLIGLGVAMDLLRTNEVIAGDHEQTFLSPMIPNAVERPFHHSRLLDLKRQRAAHVSVLLAISQAEDVMAHLERAS